MNIKTVAAILGVALALTANSHAQVTIDDFNTGTTTGQVVAGTNWVGQVTPTATTIVVTGGENNGWGATGVSLNATGMNFIAVTASVDAGNFASSFVVRFSDDFLETEVFSTPIATSFTNTLSTYYIPISWTSAIDITNITSWSIGGGGVSSTAFHMTIDNVAMTSAVPEPSTYAMIFGVLALGFVAWRRRSVSV